MNDTKYAKITISIPQRLLDWIDREAKRDERSRSYVISKMAERIIAQTENERAQSKRSEFTAKQSPKTKPDKAS